MAQRRQEPNPDAEEAKLSLKTAEDYQATKDDESDWEPAPPAKGRATKAALLRQAPTKTWRFFPPASATDDEGTVVPLSADEAEHAADPDYWQDVILPRLG